MTIDEETVAHWRPGLRGAYALFTDPTTPVTEPTDNVPPDASFAFDLLKPTLGPRSLARISPFWEAVWERGEPDWVLQAGQYEYTPDHRPYLGPIATSRGWSLNCGYSGHGIMASAGGSRLTVDALLGRVAAGARTRSARTGRWSSARSTSCDGCRMTRAGSLAAPPRLRALLTTVATSRLPTPGARWRGVVGGALAPPATAPGSSQAYS